MFKVAVIGGGSTYTPELVNGFLERHDQLPLDELWLADIDPERLEIVGGFARRMAEAAGSPFRVVLTCDRQAAVQDAAYVLTQLRVGKMAARIADEYLGRRHGLIGQETTGIGGMAKALRTIPAVLEIADEMRRSARPGALLINFANPSGLVTEALFRCAADIPAVGVCNSAFHTKMLMLAGLESSLGQPVDPSRAQLRALGLNHLTWYHGFTLDGEEIWPTMLGGYLAQLRGEGEPEWPPQLIERLGMIPNSYLHYFYETPQKLAEQQAWPPSRGEQVLAIETNLLARYADPALTRPPDELMQRGGAYYSTVATQLLAAHWNDLGEVHVVNTRHAGAVPGWPADWVLELPARIDAAGIHPLPIDPLPAEQFALIERIKQYEILTVQAAVSGDRQAARAALLLHPLGPPAAQVDAVLEDLLETHRAHLPRFWS